MKTLAYASWAVAAAVAIWYVVQGGEDPHPMTPAAFALSLGAGLAFSTAGGVSEGSIRARSRRVERADAPRTFWAVVAIRYTVSALMIGGGIWYLLAG